MSTDPATQATEPLGPDHEPREQTAALVKRAPLPKTIAPFVLSDDEMRRTWRMASSLAASHLFKDSHSAEQAFGKILIGRDLGISPTQALQTLDIVEGAIFMRGVLLASWVRKSPDYHYKVIERTNTGCRLLFLGFPQDEQEEGYVRSAGRWWEVLSEETFTVADAQTAGLVRDKGNWKKYPKNMCFWRCISNAVKMEAPDLLGGVPIYTEADERPTPAAALGDGEGNGEPAGIDLGPEVDAVIARAAELGHAALADRGTVEMQLGDQPPERVAAWIKAARAELDAMPPDAAVVTEPDPRPVSPSGAQAGDSMAAAGEGRETAAYAPPTAQEQRAADELGVPIVSQGFLDDGPPRRAEPVMDADRIAAMNRRVGDLLNDADALDDTDPRRAQECRDEAGNLMTAIESAGNANQGELPL